MQRYPCARSNGEAQPKPQVGARLPATSPPAAPTGALAGDAQAATAARPTWSLKPPAHRIERAWIPPEYFVG